MQSPPSPDFMPPSDVMGPGRIPAPHPVSEAFGKRPRSWRGWTWGLRGAALCALLGGAASALGAQTVEDPVVPRGKILFQIGGGWTLAQEVFGATEPEPLGSAFFQPVQADRFSPLTPVQEAFRKLTEKPDLTLSLGRTAGRMQVEEEVLPMRLGYGVFNRVSLGLTVPLVRRKTDSHLFLDGEGANAGLAPPRSLSGAFRTESRAALLQLQSRVQEACLASGEGSEACERGRSTESQLVGFLGLLESLWDAAGPFPLQGSDAGNALLGRWNLLRGEMAAWGAMGPEVLPLATSLLSTADLRRTLVDPVWGGSGFPVEANRAYLELGDVEAHLGMGLLRIDAGDRGFGFRSGVEVTVRLPTGVPDSLAWVTPLSPPRGYAGGGVRWVNDLVLGERLGLLVTLDWSTFLERDQLFVGLNPDRPWDLAARRGQFRGAPGDRLLWSAAPRWAITPGLSLGGGIEQARNGAGQWTELGSSSGAGTVRSVNGGTQQLALFELRMAGWSVPLRDQMRFPTEVSVRGAWAFSGDAGLPRERRVDLKARLLSGG